MAFTAECKVFLDLVRSLVGQQSGVFVWADGSSADYVKLERSQAYIYNTFMKFDKTLKHLIVQALVQFGGE